MKKRLLCLLVVTSLILTFSGCKNKKNNEVSSAPEAGLDITEDASAEKEVVKVEDYSLEDIAALNGISVQELNYLTGYDGELLFVGGKYGEEKVTNYEEALASLDHLKSLAKLKRLNFEYNRTDVSPVTGNIIYTFYQTANTEIGSETMAAKFFNSLVKVITDKDGNLIGASCDITPSYEVERLDESDVITKEEACEYVRNLINDKNRRIYEDISEYAYWEDQGTVLSVDASSKISPAWFIYTDAAGGNNVEKPYEVFVVSLTPKYSTDENDNTVLVPAVIASFFVETLDPNDLTGVYTSLFYFDGMKDAGEYTYEIDMSWVKKYSEEYTGPDKVEYTVPVMYSEKEDLYYLGDADRKVTLSNYYDFQMLDSTNAYVTSTPEDKDSWHFQLDTAPDGSTGKYFDNPDYVLSSFSVMYDVWEDFSERYGLDSVDGTGLPTMLTVYLTYDDEYPENEEDFEYNAVNKGQNRDWQVMGTSISFPGCLEHEVMAHEYTHGINGQLTMSQYLNEPGAVMESYADIIGDQISMLEGYPECTDDNAWHLGGTYGPYMRNMANPKEFFMPQYVGGNYYLNPIAEVIGDEFDMGGVHTNSSLLNYLAYCMVNGTGSEGEAVLTMDECLDIWLDTLYYTNYQTDYYDVACYLKLSAQSLGLSGDKISYLDKLLADFGFGPGEDGKFKVRFEEDSDCYYIHLEYDESKYNNIKDVFKFGFTFSDTDDNYYQAGGIDEEGDLYYCIDPDIEFDFVEITIGNQLDYDYNTYNLEYLDKLPHDINIFFSYSEINPGDTLTANPGYEFSYAKSFDGCEYSYEEDEDGIGTLTVENEGTLVISLRNNDASTDDFGAYSLMMVYSQED